MSKEVETIDNQKLMDEGKIPWVWLKMPEKEKFQLPIHPKVMEEMKLKQGQEIDNKVLDKINEVMRKLLEAGSLV